MATEERRSNSIEMVLISLGKLEQSATDIKETVDKLDTKVGIQNGKVGKLEKWQALIQGAVGVLILMVLPIITNFVSSWLKFTFQGN